MLRCWCNSSLPAHRFAMLRCAFTRGSSASICNIVATITTFVWSSLYLKTGWQQYGSRVGHSAVCVSMLRARAQDAAFPDLMLWMGLRAFADEPLPGMNISCCVTARVRFHVVLQEAPSTLRIWSLMSWVPIIRIGRGCRSLETPPTCSTGVVPFFLQCVMRSRRAVCYCRRRWGAGCYRQL